LSFVADIKETATGEKHAALRKISNLAYNGQFFGDTSSYDLLTQGSYRRVLFLRNRQRDGRRQAS
jgi:hypothetical protein